MTNRELDVLVASRVMRLPMELIHTGPGPKNCTYQGHTTLVAELTHYSSTGEGMLAVIDAMERHHGFKSHNGFTLMKLDGAAWYAEFSEPSWQEATADSAPRAVAMAALRAVGYEPDGVSP